MLPPACFMCGSTALVATAWPRMLTRSWRPSPLAPPSPLAAPAEVPAHQRPVDDDWRRRRSCRRRQCVAARGASAPCAAQCRWRRACARCSRSHERHAALPPVPPPSAAQAQAHAHAQAQVHERAAAAAAVAPAATRRGRRTRRWSTRRHFLRRRGAPARPCRGRRALGGEGALWWPFLVASVSCRAAGRCVGAYAVPSASRLPCA